LRRRRALATAAAASMIVGGGCARGAHTVDAAAQRFPARVVPARVAGYEIRDEPKLAANYGKAKASDAMVATGRVFTVRADDVIQGSVQVALFKPNADLQNKGLRQDVEDGLNAGSVETHHLGLIRVRALTLPEQNMYLWFPPDHNVMELFIMRKSFREAESVVDSIIEYQRGLPTALTVS
jgi:hypothetical protein